MGIESDFLNFSAAKLEECLTRIEACVGKLTPEQIWQRATENENAIGNLMLHLSGNVRQWILSGVGGQPEVRDRDAEFAARGLISPAELKDRLRKTIEETTAVIRALPPERLSDPHSKQGYESTVLTAIYHVVEHFVGHTFQIIFITKLLTSEDLGFYAHFNPKRRAGA